MQQTHQCNMHGRVQRGVYLDGGGFNQTRKKRMERNRKTCISASAQGEHRGRRNGQPALGGGRVNGVRGWPLETEKRKRCLLHFVFRDGWLRWLIFTHLSQPWWSLWINKVYIILNSEQNLDINLFTLDLHTILSLTVFTLLLSIVIRHGVQTRYRLLT